MAIPLGAPARDRRAGAGRRTIVGANAAGGRDHRGPVPGRRGVVDLVRCRLSGWAGSSGSHVRARCRPPPDGVGPAERRTALAGHGDGLGPDGRSGDRAGAARLAGRCPRFRRFRPRLRRRTAAWHPSAWGAAGPWTGQPHRRQSCRQRQRIVVTAHAALSTLLNLAIAALFGLGVAALITRGNLLKKLIGLVILQASTWMLLIGLADANPSAAINPLPFAIASVAVLLGLIWLIVGGAVVLRLRAAADSVEDDELTSFEIKRRWLTFRSLRSFARLWAPRSA
ncbi:MAG: hypothetical protein EXQ85_03470 [Alphaproteobacteria bacterium]|nr:hypothetical protein [Alphaproteobacteria bacterium]